MLITTRCFYSCCWKNVEIQQMADRESEGQDWRDDDDDDDLCEGM